MKRLMLLAAMLAMMMAAAVPALAQTVTQVGQGNVACVQNAVQNNITGNDSPQGNGNAQANQYGDNIIANNISSDNAQAIAQSCNITVEQVNTVVNNLTVNEAGKVVVVKAKKVVATASASASASTTAKAGAAAVQYQYKTPAKVQYTATATASAGGESAAAAAELPSTGGASLIALGAGVLLVAGGLLARRIVR